LIEIPDDPVKVNPPFGSPQLFERRPENKNSNRGENV